MFRKFLEFLKSLFKQQIEHPPLPVGEVNKPLTRLPWMEWAERELHTSEQNNPERIKYYHSFTKLPRNFWHALTAWCASFMSCVLSNSGCKSPNTARAKDFLNYGEVLTEPRYGCIVVYDREGGGHVNFFLRESGGLIYGLGGNQNNCVCVKAYKKSDVLGYRWPIELKKSVKAG